MTTALGEGATGLVLLVLPSVLLELLLGVEQASPEVNVAARIAGAALLAIGVACWIGRCEKQGSALIGILSGVLIYNVAGAGILAYAGVFTDLVGIALWPAVVVHGALAVWCVMCVRGM
jgi:hypothetical protein